MAKGKRSKKSGVSIDFEGVEAGGKAIPDGSYLAEVVEVEERESQSGNDNLNWKWKITGGPAKGAVLFDNTSLQPQALWRLKGLLEVLGEEVPDGAMDLDLSSLVGREALLEVTNETYEGKKRPRITGFADPEGAEETGEEEEEEEEEEKPSKKSSKASKKSSSKLKAGTKVKWKDDNGKTVKGVVVSVDGDVATVEDGEQDEWEIEASELTAL